MVDVKNGVSLSHIHDVKHVILGNAWKSGFDLSPNGAKLAVSSVFGNPLGDGQEVGYTDVYSVDLDHPVLSLVSYRFEGKITRYSRTGRFLAVAGTNIDEISGVVLREFDTPGKQQLPK